MVKLHMPIESSKLAKSENFHFTSLNINSRSQESKISLAFRNKCVNNC